MLSELAFPNIRCCLSAIPSDLMKSTAVDESLSSINQQLCSRENQLLQMLQQNEKSTQIHLPVCDKSCNDKCSLSVHMCMHTESILKYKLLWNKTFRNKKDLVIHKNTP